MKRILKLTLIMLLTLTPKLWVSAEPLEEGQPEYSTGLIWDSLEVIESKLQEDPPYESALPPSIDLKDEFPTPGNQGKQNSCVAWAVAYALKSHQEEARQNWGLTDDSHLFSPSYVYNQCNDGKNDGMGISEGMELLVNQGVCTLASFPYNQSDLLSQPTPENRKEAATFRISDWTTIKGVDSIKKYLASGDGVIIGVGIYPDFEKISSSNPIFDVKTGTSRGSHAICLIGYDNEKNAFKFINSWGTGWGLDGYGWISYDLMGESYGFVMETINDTSIIYEEPFDYTVSDDKATITRYLDFGLGDNVVIPDTLGGYPVTKIAHRAFLNSTSITSVTIPDSVTSIATYAFSGCTSLTDVTISDSVTYIDSNVFYDCNSLKNISVGANNPNFSSDDGVLFDKNKTTLIKHPAGKLDSSYEIPDYVTTISSSAFIDCKSLISVVIPINVEYVGAYAFNGLPNNAIIYVHNIHIRSLVTRSGFPIDRIITENITSNCGNDLIWELKESTLIISGTGDMWNSPDPSSPWYSFKNDITKVVIGNGATSIGDWAFVDCTSLTDITIPDSVTSIGYSAFSNCTSLTNITIPDSVTSIGNYSFMFCRSLTNVTIPNNVTSIGNWAFMDCTSLTDITLPDSLTSIGYGAFSDLHETAKIYVPNQTIKSLVADSGFAMNRIIILVDNGVCGDDLTWEFDVEGTLTISGIGDMWDYTSSDASWHPHLDSIKNVIIEKGVTAIGAGAFDDCLAENLTINMPTIGLTFANMTTLQSITIGYSVTSIENGAFSGLPNTTIYVPNQNMKSLVVESGFPVERILIPIIATGVCGDNLTWNLNKEGTLTISGTGDMADYALPRYIYVTEIIIENGVTSIGDGAFSDYFDLTHIEIPNSVTKIGSAAFISCASLTNVVIPDSVTEIGDYVFNLCTSLTDIFIPDSVTEIGNLAFDNCILLTINCYENSYAHNYAIENDIPVSTQFKAKTQTIEVSTLANAENIIVNHITVTNTVDGFYNLAVDFEKSGDVYVFLAVYVDNLLTNAYLADGNAEIEGITESNLANSKIYIWDKNMQPCIEVIKQHNLY